MECNCSLSLDIALIPGDIARTLLRLVRDIRDRRMYVIGDVSQEEAMQPKKQDKPDAHGLITHVTYQASETSCRILRF